MLITKDKALAVLEPFAHRLVLVINKAWNDWLNRIKENPSCSKRGRSNFIWDQIIHHALEEFKFEPDHVFAIRPYNNGSTYNFIINQNLLFRVKKGNPARLSHNIPTSMALDFHNPEQELPEVGNIPRIEIQYELDRLESSIIDIVAVARNNLQIVWESSLLYREGDQLSIHDNKPVAPNNDNNVKRRVKPKTGDAVIPKPQKIIGD